MIHSHRSENGKLEITTEQEHTLMKLWDWRDLTSRIKDESLYFIMTNRELLRISLSLPSNENELLRYNNIPDSTRMYAKEIIDIILSNATDNSFTPVKFHLSAKLMKSATMKTKFLRVSKKRKVKKLKV